jgi:hypothetical protein
MDSISFNIFKKMVWKRSWLVRHWEGSSTHKNKIGPMVRKTLQFSLWLTKIKLMKTCTGRKKDSNLSKKCFSLLPNKLKSLYRILLISWQPRSERERGIGTMVPIPFQGMVHLPNLLQVGSTS